MKQLPLILDIFLLILVLPFGATTAKAAPPPPVTSYTVNSIADPGDGVCNVTNCTLREAISDANLNAYAGTVSILFSVNGRILLTSSLPSPNRGVLGLNINATTHDIVISGDDSYRIMYNPPVSILTLQNLTFSQGYTTAEGGAIKNSGNLTISNVTFQSNFANWGGAIYSDGGVDSLTVLGSTFKNNTANLTGGAIHNAAAYSTIINNTFSGNSAVNGGAVYNGSGYLVSLVNCTISQNSTITGGSVENSSGTLRLHNTIVANATTGPNCVGAIQNYGNNLDSGSSCGWTTVNGSLSSTDPRLMPLNNYGGRTQTFALRAGSPAIDAVTYEPADYPGTDQRGVNRPVDGNFNGSAAADIGAYEMGPTVVLPLVIR